MSDRPQARESTSLIVYFHGPALVTLGLNSHRRFVSRLSAGTGAKVLNVGYRLAPQASIEEAVADGLDGYRFALAQGFAPERIVLAGDSAGGLMAADVALAARDAGLPVPAGQALMSPLTSADMDLKYRALKDHRDVMFPFMTVKFIYDVFATVNGTRPPPLMPPEADLHGLACPEHPGLGAAVAQSHAHVPAQLRRQPRRPSRGRRGRRVHPLRDNRAGRDQRLAASRLLVSEVPRAGQVQRHAGLLRCGSHLVVAH
jgi:acetyl esterase/lipase